MPCEWRSPLGGAPHRGCCSKSDLGTAPGGSPPPPLTAQPRSGCHKPGDFQRIPLDSFPFLPISHICSLAELSVL